MYRASVLPISKDLIKEADSLFYYFIWNGKDKVKWNVMILEVEKGGLNILAKTPSLLHKIANEIIWNNKLLCINKKSVYFISTEENLNPEQGFFIMGLINSTPAN